MARVSYGQRLRDLAAADADRTALVFDDVALTRGALLERAEELARVFLERGVVAGRRVSFGLPNGPELVIGTVATWLCGAVPNPLPPKLPARERAAILALADPALVLGFEDAVSEWPSLAADASRAAAPAAPPLPDCTPPHERVLASGGSTGRPKLIELRNPASLDPEAPATVLSPSGTVLVPGPLYHAAPFGSLTQALLAGEAAVVMGRFAASRCLALIERHRVEQALFVPTMLHRIWRLPEAERSGRDVSSLRRVFTGGAPCPPWLTRAFIGWLGADVMHELYGGSERIGGTFISGREWLAHPGSVGRPTRGTEMRILDPATGRELPAGEVGEIYMRPPGGPGSTYRYVGAEGRVTDDGFESVGDLGSVDAEGYLYLADRRTDLILTGGRNVYPAQVEAALDEHPDVLSSAVIGLPDEDLGQRIHAIVQTTVPVDDETLRAHLAERLVPYAVPRSYERVESPLRDEAGKLRRFALRAARTGEG